ncbi:ENTH-domain-containing protein [Melanomma pulvis-pyrius CBS 109.77]|uniref:ENTH-domain-containing protein n=1 Tax=Melanomma pulvis-pyrius CBS 109.77 TaxID=1314802 RepID=A0A6A6XVK2_9PLEO|nr:ENTH-domain-containing protein [Melanomma pulvis-pyrius CBS 109.77]
MDFSSLKDKVSNLTLYDIKAGVRQVQNAVMNYTEMEAKVREATNNEPWGASSSIMQEIASGTFNYQLLNEIMPMIYKRFTEKAAEEWRQIYKALQLLEFLIKNGSERVIDDARSHVSLLKMLRQFHFIDQNGKDQGINVRNRAKELAELLGDVERIRSERKKARANRSKFGGVEGGLGLNSGFSGSGGGGGSRYGGFGSEQADYGGYSGGVYGDGGGFGGDQASSGFSDTQARRERGGGYEEYDEYDEGEVTASPVRRKEPTAPSSSHVKRETKKEEPKAKAKEPVPDLLAWDDEPAPISSSAGKQPIVAAANDFGADDDDFDDFQSAAPAAPVASLFAKPPAAPFVAPPNSTSTITSSTQFAAPQPQSGAQTNNLNDLFSTVSPPPAGNKFASPPISSPATASSISQPYRPAGFQSSGPNYFTSVPVGQNTSQSAGSTPSVLSPSIGGKKIGSVAPKASGGDAFASLLSSAAPRKTNTPTQKVTMADMAKQKTSAGLWGAPASSSSTPAAQTSGSKPGGALGDLLG